MTGAKGKAQAIRMLTDMQKKLHAEGLDRLPQRSDYPPEQLVQIKAHLGPMPRALEAAGLKVPRDAEAFAEQKRAKRIAAKRRKTEAKLANRKDGSQ